MRLDDRVAGRHRRRTLAKILAGAALAISPGRARAEPTAQERAAAEALFQDARKLALDHRIDEACVKFAESQRLDPRVGTLMYLATCHAQQNRTATAWVEFTEALAMAQRAGQREREAQARERAAELEAKLSKVTFRLEGSAAGAVVRVGGQEIRSFDTALPFDPGPLAVEATAPGKKPWSQTVTVPPGPSLQHITIPALAPLPAGEPPRAAPPIDPTPAPDRTGRWITAGVLGGVGIAGVVTGSVFGLRAKQQYQDADRYCMGRYCTQPGLDGHADATRSATISTIAFCVAGAGLVAGTIVAVTIPRDRAKRSAATLRVGPGPALTVRAAF
jgi:hypothetical protein